MGDFNSEPHYRRLGHFLEGNDLVNLKNPDSYETGLSEHYHMVLIMLKTT